jgi:hypothetical protein
VPNKSAWTAVDGVWMLGAATDNMAEAITVRQDPISFGIAGWFTS